MQRSQLKHQHQQERDDVRCQAAAAESGRCHRINSESLACGSSSPSPAGIKTSPWSTLTVGMARNPHLQKHLWFPLYGKGSQVEGPIILGLLSL